MNYLDAYVANVSKTTGIDPATIAAIIAFIMQMVAMCKPAPTPPTVTDPSNIRRIVLYRALLANGIRPLSAQGRGLADAMESEASKLTPDGANAFLLMCGG